MSCAAPEMHTCVPNPSGLTFTRLLAHTDGLEFTGKHFLNLHEATLQHNAQHKGLEAPGTVNYSASGYLRRNLPDFFLHHFPAVHFQQSYFHGLTPTPLSWNLHLLHAIKSLKENK